ncbi:hypothetical protein C798_27175 [Herbaspirillum rubrisubalbicans Os34]|uniref:Uncharacterized protein n=1 Tax=Herbaspirillum rubrisubalbicans Os34 TaxID=1235827 RepID=A0A6M4A2C8_9BURK|nr:hypothetical protein C798_27175 [Herbaspirillum rubrisubalbicans Os34]
MASIKLDSVVGQPEVHINEVVANSIPGYATYFWAIPQRNVIASIKFKHSATGQRPMSTYVSRFMATYSSYALVSTDADGNDIIVGFTDDPASNEPKAARPAFKTGIFPKPGAVAYILANHERIKKVIRRGHVSSQKAVDVSLWQSARRFLRSPERFAGYEPVKERVYLELEYQPNLEELQEMIQAETEDPDVSGWEDMGFEFQGEGNKRHWLGKAAASGEFNLDIDRSGEETVNLAALLTTLNDNANEILKLLD